MPALITPLDAHHAAEVMSVYVSAAGTGTLGRDSDEYDLAEVAESLRAAAADGLCFGAVDEEGLVGVIRAARLKARRFRHVVSGLTAAVHPSQQGRGVGRSLFVELLARVDALDPAVTRVELMLQAGNASALCLYRSLGFAEEGLLRARVRRPDGTLVDDILMGRVRPPR